ncbi:uncharacterized protein DUF4390 [Crenobacter luteus]|uniref:DUF4390 domain-containing protein n=1 Tax=Crenobacter luteus TaxID=1452487 RepID=A0A165G1H6_9NEIS|nr:hypothetical protein AVW16_05860 [Crenobacter luteus]TCP15256.1 uncharacterized protein DUF4390 [Crenobacter luteus]
MTAFITRCLRNASLLLGLWLVLVPAVMADNIAASRAEAELVDGQLALNTRFQTRLPAALSDALAQGVPLTFRLDFELTRPRAQAYRLDLANWFEPHASLTFKLAYQSLTGRYRVTIGTLPRFYPTLAEALSAIGTIRGWRVLEAGALAGVNAGDVRARARLELDISELPKPFQFNALGSNDWALSSGWVALAVKEAG